MATLSKATLDAIAAAVAAAMQAQATTPARTAEASQHYVDRDLAVPCCSRTFRTEKGRAWHIANFHKA